MFTKSLLQYRYIHFLINNNCLFVLFIFFKYTRFYNLLITGVRELYHLKVLCSKTRGITM